MVDSFNLRFNYQYLNQKRSIKHFTIRNILYLKYKHWYTILYYQQQSPSTDYCDFVLFVMIFNHIQLVVLDI